MANFYTDKGEELTADYVDGTASAPTNWFNSWGTGGGTHSKASNALITESAEARVAVTESQPAADQNQWVATITSASTQSIDEAGIHTLAAAGDMFCVADFTAIPLVNGDKIEFTWTVTWS
jgi:hypothetical protein